ncbi:hypothetical protein BCR41DRAFT_371715 [Lobosporangium transversale]|uniref:Transmembrane protein 198 n=1 Tax=Lobosporangium transversale TaxID=64571 RepID=A0A1Y2GJZ6_9FUNG|nr:hypothetical protein BCR41DRAFT_371715 [Lobosporangium transversale]ORZ13019.1 hypothetical protein BCR41DRAFT_371715 [Lobosporangium transversale]|eukprot:XP_021880368.1 hypothetical protein BCR41DRAFT_371715 [Lobosporangium transversale]
MVTFNRPLANRMMGSLHIFLTYMLPLLVLAQQQQPPPTQPDGNGQSSDLTWQKIVAGFVLLLVGIILSFRGYRYYRTSMFLAGFIAGCVIVYSIFKSFEPDSGWKHRQIIYVFGCIGGGLLIGSICWLFYHYAAWMLGAVAGLAVALYILGWRNGGLIRSKGGRVGLLAGASALGLIFGLLLGRKILIPASAIVGAYVAILGVDLFAHTGFVDSVRRFFSSDSRIDYNLTTNLYIMLGVVGGLMLLGFLFQVFSWRRQRKLMKEQGRDTYEYEKDWTPFGQRKPRAIRPDSTYPDGRQSEYNDRYSGYNSYNNYNNYNNPANAPVASTSAGTALRDNQQEHYNEKSSWNPLKKNKETNTTTTVQNDYPDNRVSYNSQSALNQPQQ